MALPADVTSVEEQTQAVEALVGRFGGLYAAFANAGLGASRSGAEQGDPDEWRQMLEVNIWGLLVMLRLALPHLRASQGHVMLTGSRTARTELSGSVYGATKHFVHGYAANLLAEMRSWGGRCTVAAPGIADTPFFSEAEPKGLHAEDVAGAVIYALEPPARLAVGERSV